MFPIGLPTLLAFSDGKVLIKQLLNIKNTFSKLNSRNVFVLESHLLNSHFFKKEKRNKKLKFLQEINQRLVPDLHMPSFCLQAPYGLEDLILLTSIFNFCGFPSYFDI